MPATVALVDVLRARGVAAVVSGAGPTVLVLTTTGRVDADAAELRSVAPSGWCTRRLGVQRSGASAGPC